ncbi:unnamed protein product, partial [Mesorhabditis belari]|uniref:SCP domain-containing protein n=1 Tax=Mesorhabditis belari TaxID=2138241 RepID=A0AAF3JAN5_9BILA
MNSLILFFTFVTVATAAYTVFAPALQTYIVNTHNNIRSNVAKGLVAWKNGIDGTKRTAGLKYPKATNMYQLVWDPTLAASAGRRAASKNSSETATYPYLNAVLPAGVGENHYGLAVGPMTPANLAPKTKFDNAMFQWSFYKKWGLPNIKYTKPSDPIAFSGQDNSYQLFAANTYAIGCAFATYQPQDSFVVVCHYKAKGLTVGVPIYKNGTICSACPAGSKCVVAKGLCAKN